MTGFPGYLADATPEQVSALAKMCIYMHVGELDSGWVGEMKDQAAQFRALSANDQRELLFYLMANMAVSQSAQAVLAAIEPERPHVQ